MIGIEVRVIGPGGIINTEMYHIQKALEAIGCVVKVVNDYPPRNSTEMINAASAVKDGGGVEVTLIAQHCPWGG